MSQYRKVCQSSNLSVCAGAGSKMDKPQMILHVSKPVTYTVFWCGWVPSSAKVLVLGNHPRGTGAMQIYELQRGDLQLLSDVCLLLAHTLTRSLALQPYARPLIYSAISHTHSYTHTLFHSYTLSISLESHSSHS